MPQLGPLARCHSGLQGTDVRIHVATVGKKSDVAPRPRKGKKVKDLELVGKEGGSKDPSELPLSARNFLNKERGERADLNRETRGVSSSKSGRFLERKKREGGIKESANEYLCHFLANADTLPGSV